MAWVISMTIHVMEKYQLVTRKHIKDISNLVSKHFLCLSSFSESDFLIASQLIPPKKELNFIVHYIKLHKVNATYIKRKFTEVKILN